MLHYYHGSRGRGTEGNEEARVNHFTIILPLEEGKKFVEVLRDTQTEWEENMAGKD